MAIKNYYVVLGVPREASTSGIRSAYRRLAKRHHPDRAGEQGKRAFQEIAEAYSVLSDPELRRAHNQRLDETEALPKRPRGPNPRPTVVEPLRAPSRVEGTSRESPPTFRVVTLRRRCAGCQGTFPARLFCLECGGTGVEYLGLFAVSGR
jgi:DnaJ-class molecular chaperone